jgi:hypothetical protein
VATSIGGIKIWVGQTVDRPGGLARKLRALSDAGANLEFIIARRSPDQPGTGVVFVAPIKGRRQQRAALAAGFDISDSLHAVRVEGPDRPGLAARLTEALAGAGINLRGLSAASIKRRCVIYLSFDHPDTAARAARVLRRLAK